MTMGQTRDPDFYEPVPQNRLITARDASLRYGVSVETIHRAVRDGRVKHIGAIWTGGDLEPGLFIPDLDQVFVSGRDVANASRQVLARPVSETTWSNKRFGIADPTRIRGPEQGRRPKSA